MSAMPSTVSIKCPITDCDGLIDCDVASVPSESKAGALTIDLAVTTYRFVGDHRHADLSMADDL